MQPASQSIYLSRVLLFHDKSPTTSSSMRIAIAFSLAHSAFYNRNAKTFQCGEKMLSFGGSLRMYFFRYSDDTTAATFLVYPIR